MRSRTFMVLVLLSLTLAAPAAAATIPRGFYATCGTACATLSAQGGGVLREWATGATWGRVERGRIAVLDRSDNGKRNWSVVGARGKRLGNGFTVFAGRNLAFSASTAFTVKIAGKGVSVSSFAKGSAFIRGSGGYHLNGGPRRSWPAGGRTLRLRG
jgi:hypothetical protein